MNDRTLARLRSSRLRVGVINRDVDEIEVRGVKTIDLCYRIIIAVIRSLDYEGVVSARRRLCKLNPIYRNGAADPRRLRRWVLQQTLRFNLRKKHRTGQPNEHADQENY